MPKIELIQGDCLEKMKDIPDGSVDMVLTDPPYGTQTNQRGDSFMVGEFSNVLPLALPEIHRVMAANAAFYSFTSWKQMPEWLLRFQQYFKLQNILIWDKQRHSGCYSPSSWQFTWEGIYFGLKGKRKIRDYQRDVMISSQKGKRRAMEKPIDVLEQMILASTDEGDTVLDPFMGSGTTGGACKNLNRNFIGIELDPEYFKIAEKRINENL